MIIEIPYLFLSQTQRPTIFALYVLLLMSDRSVDFMVVEAIALLVICKEKFAQLAGFWLFILFDFVIYSQCRHEGGSCVRIGAYLPRTFYGALNLPAPQVTVLDSAVARPTVKRAL